MSFADKVINFSVAPAGASTTLATRVQGLTAGTSILLGDTGIPATADQFNWQSRFFYDSARGYAFATGKKQSPVTSTWVGQFNEASNSWTGGLFQFPRTTRGHVYEGVCYDPATGNGYFLENGGAVDRIGVHALGDAFNTWTYVGQDPETKGLPATGQLLASTGNFITDSSSLAFHPNLYGTGIAGIVVACHFGFAAYRPSNDTYSTIMSKAVWSAALGGATSGLTASCYVAGLNIVLISAGQDGVQLWKVAAGGGALTQLTSTVTNCGPDRGAGSMIKLVDDPEGGPTCYGLEAGGARRLFKFNNTTGTLADTGFAHPFTAIDGNNENFIFASCKPVGCTHGAIWGIEESSTGWRSRLYRPAV